MTHEMLAERWHVRNVGLWMFLGTIVMLFAAFTSAMVVRASAGDWAHPQLPPVLWIDTIVIAASSLALEKGRRIGLDGQGAVAFVALSTALGLVFLVGQIVAWRDLMHAGLYLPSNPSSSFFYLLTGIHAVHVIAALVALMYLFAKTIAPPNRREWPYLAGSIATFWHFLAGTWFYLFIILHVA